MVLASLKDSTAISDIEKQLALSNLQFWHDGKVRAGEDRTIALNRAWRSAELFVFISSSDFMSDDELADLLEKAVREGKPIIGVRYRPVSEPSWMRRITLYPEKPVTVYDNRDADWVKVAEAIIQAAAHLRRNSPPQPATTISMIDLYHAATNAMLDRDALLSGINRKFVREIPGNKIITDLGEMYGVTLTDGTVPLKLWLQTAAALADPRQETVTFQTALANLERGIWPTR